MVKPALVSVVVPTFNRRDLLREAVESVLHQTYPHWEAIIVDDGSVDGTREMVEGLFGSESRIRYVWQPNGGQGAARNHGIRATSGDYIAFLDSDDLWEPDKLALQVPLLDNNAEVVLVHCGHHVIDSENRIIQTGVRERREGETIGSLFVPLVYGNKIGSPIAAVVRRSAVVAAGGFDETRRLDAVGIDWELWLRIARMGRVEYVPQALARYRAHTGNTLVSMDPAGYDLIVATALSLAPSQGEKRQVLALAERRYWGFVDCAVWQKRRAKQILLWLGGARRFGPGFILRGCKYRMIRRLENAGRHA